MAATHYKRAKERVELRCSHCKGTFFLPRYLVAKQAVRYCSPNCYALAAEKRERIVGVRFNAQS